MVATLRKPQLKKLPQTFRDGHVVLLHGEQSVESWYVDPSHVPLMYCPGWQYPHGAQRVVSKVVLPSHLNTAELVPVHVKDIKCLKRQELTCQWCRIPWHTCLRCKLRIGYPLCPCQWRRTRRGRIQMDTRSGRACPNRYVKKRSTAPNNWRTDLHMPHKIKPEKDTR